MLLQVAFTLLMDSGCSLIEYDIYFKESENINKGYRVYTYMGVSQCVCVCDRRILRLYLDEGLLVSTRRLVTVFYYTINTTFL